MPEKSQAGNRGCRRVHSPRVLQLRRRDADTAIRGKLDADNLTAGFVQVRVAGLLAVLTGNVAKKDASDRAEEIARSTKVTVDSDKPIVAGSVQNLIKVGAK